MSGVVIERAAPQDLFSPSPGAAWFSPDGVYRYRLERHIPDLTASTQKTIAWIMLNPSTADAMTDDRTIRRVMTFSRRARAEHVIVANLFALRATRPAALKAAPDPVGPDNDTVIRQTVQDADLVVCAWGPHGTLHGRDAHVRALLREAKVRAWCLARTLHGHPGHPLYLPTDSPLQRYPVAGALG